MDPPAKEHGLRIGGYVDRARHRAPEPREPALILPNISDYWPEPPPPGPDRPGPESSGGTVRPDRRRSQRQVALTGAVALAVVVGTVLLARPLADSEIRQRQQQALAPSIIPLQPRITVAPQPPPLLLSPTPSLTPSPPVVRAARFDFVAGVTELTVRIADLGDQTFQVVAPAEAGTSFTDGVVRIEVTKPNGPVEVRLSDRIVWHLRLAAGVKFGTFDLSSGTVSRIDLDGGAERFDLTLGRLGGVVPVRMTGGVGTWIMRTDGQVPARVAVGDGAGNIKIYGDERGGTGTGAVIESGTLGDGPGLDVDAAAGIGSLEITRR